MIPFFPLLFHALPFHIVTPFVLVNQPLACMSLVSVGEARCPVKSGKVPKTPGKGALTWGPQSLGSSLASIVQSRVDHLSILGLRSLCELKKIELSQP